MPNWFRPGADTYAIRPDGCCVPGVNNYLGKDSQALSSGILSFCARAISMSIVQFATFFVSPRWRWLRGLKRCYSVADGVYQYRLSGHDFVLIIGMKLK